MLQLPDFKLIAEVLDSERKAILKVNNIGEDEQHFVRPREDALIILNFIEEILSVLHPLFERYPSLTALFDKEFTPYSEFIKREYIINNIFFDDCLFPEKDSFLFGYEGRIDEQILAISKKSLVEWAEQKESAHNNTTNLLQESFHMDLKKGDLECGCNACISEYRNQNRDFVWQESVQLIDSAHQELEKVMDNELDTVVDTFQDLKRGIDKLLHRIRYRLRRGTLNSLEKQIKERVREMLTYPAPIAIERERVIKLNLKQHLDEEGIKEDLVEEEQWRKFLSQMSTNIWRGKKYLHIEFKKVLNSLMYLKRQDILGTILQNYIGEFWVHSQARSITRKIIYHMGPTNSGKTYHAIKSLCQVKKGCYLAPLRLLAAELYDTMNNNNVPTTLLTGEEIIEVEGATHYSSTIEMARMQEFFDCCVIDEIQMISDPQRGWAWTRALINIFAEEVHICGDSSVLDLVKQIVEICGDKLEIKTYERMTELKVEKNAILMNDLRRSDALIVFSRRNALKYKRDLENIGFKVSIVYGRLSPEVRREQARKFDQGETDIMVSTDAIAMGMNLPIRRIVFSTLSKFINSQEIPITDSEIKQIAGRSGRYQRFPVGYVTALSRAEGGIKSIQKAINVELDQKEKCMVGPDLDVFNQVDKALEQNRLQKLRLSEFLRLFNTMTFKKPFFCVDLKEMIELSEIVEDNDADSTLKTSEVFGFACAPVNLNLIEHVQYYVWILSNFVNTRPILCEEVNHQSSDIDYLETSIKCIELYQWLARHFNNKNFDYVESELLNNKQNAIDKLNQLLSDKIVLTCSSCGVNLPDNTKFSICENCFRNKRFARRRRRYSGSPSKASHRRSKGDSKGGSKRASKKTTKRTARPFNKSKKHSSKRRSNSSNRGRRRSQSGSSGSR